MGAVHAQAPELSESGAPAELPDADATDFSSIIDEALATADLLIQAGRPVDAFAVLMETMDTLPVGVVDDAPLRFAVAQALMAGGRHAQAEEVLARLAEERPDNIRIRFDRALALFALGRDDEAEELFREVRRKPELPPDARRTVEGYLSSILHRQRLRFDLDLGFWYDGNVNNAAEVGTVTFPAFGNLEFALDEQPVSAWVARTGAKLRWRKPMTEDGRVIVETHASLARNTAMGKSEYKQYNRTWLSVSAGSADRVCVGDRRTLPARPVQRRCGGGAPLAGRPGIRHEPVGRVRGGPGNKRGLARERHAPDLDHVPRRPARGNRSQGTFSRPVGHAKGRSGVADPRGDAGARDYGSRNPGLGLPGAQPGIRGGGWELERFGPAGGGFGPVRR